MTARKAKSVAMPSAGPQSLKAKLQAVSGVKRGAPAGRDSDAEVVTGKGRKGRRSIAIYMQPLAKDLLDRIAHENKKSIQTLGIEALNLLFRHYDQKPIA